MQLQSHAVPSRSLFTTQIVPAGVTRALADLNDLAWERIHSGPWQVCTEHLSGLAVIRRQCSCALSSQDISASWRNLYSLTALATVVLSLHSNSSASGTSALDPELAVNAGDDPSGKQTEQAIHRLDMALLMGGQAHASLIETLIQHLDQETAVPQTSGLPALTDPTTVPKTSDDTIRAVTRATKRQRCDDASGSWSLILQLILYANNGDHVLTAAIDLPELKGHEPPAPASRAAIATAIAPVVVRIDPLRAIPRLSAPDLLTFQRVHMKPAVPVIITGGMDHWPALGRRDDSRYDDCSAVYTSCCVALP